jgi:hypothetical protein
MEDRRYHLFIKSSSVIDCDQSENMRGRGESVHLSNDKRVSTSRAQHVGKLVVRVN